MKSRLSFLSDEIKNNIIQKYINKISSCRELEKEYGVTRGSISNLIKHSNNIVNIRRKRYNVDHTYFDVINTQEKAYFLGLLYADGCNDDKKSRIIITLVESDKEILEKLKLELQAENLLYFHKTKNYKHQNTYRLEISNIYICKQLTKLGCYPRKSLTLKFPTEKQVPSHLIRHFVRGYFDGDGSIIYPQDYKITVSIVSSKYFTKQFIKVVSKILNISIREYRIKENEITKTIKIRGRLQVSKFLDWIYKDADVYIQRKYLKYLMSIND